MNELKESNHSPATDPPNSSVARLSTRNITKRFGAFRVLNDVSMNLYAGELHAVIGPNGAGKTTLFNILTGLIRPDTGDVVLEGMNVTQRPSHRRVRDGMGRSFQITTLFQNLSCRENVRLCVAAVESKGQYAFWRLLSRNDQYEGRVQEVITMLGLDSIADRVVGELSHAEQRLIEVAMAVAPGCNTILLDEPTSGMGVNDVPRMADVLQQLQGNYSVLMIEHNMRIAMGLADRVTVLNDGEIVASGTPEEVRTDKAVRAAYLGSKYAQAE